MYIATAIIHLVDLTSHSTHSRRVQHTYTYVYIYIFIWTLWAMDTVWLVAVDRATRTLQDVYLFRFVADLGILSCDMYVFR